MDSTVIFLILVGVFGIGLFIAGCVGLAMNNKPGSRNAFESPPPSENDDDDCAGQWAFWL